MEVLKVTNLTKNYPKFSLQEVSFSVESRKIMGFIGRNGAGKTTTLKSIMNMVHINSGSIEFFGLDMTKKEMEIKQRIGYASGIVDYYKKKKIKKLLAITKRFYHQWNDELCNHYLEVFSLDTTKRPAELSEGMKVKLNLAIALSHNAELLILDEPTSGLDPISRSELLEIFKLLRKKGVSILFSTHITSDLDQCADDITYIRDGKIIYTGSLTDFTNGSTLEDVMVQQEKEAFCEKFTL